MTRWVRYGHDRLYIKSDEGSDLGWYDLESGEAHPTFAASAELVIAAATDWTACHEHVRGTKAALHQPAKDGTAPLPSGPRTTSVESLRAPSSEAVPEPIARSYPPPPPPPPSGPASWAPPTGNPVRDLAQNAAGLSLEENIAEAHAAGLRPTLLRRLFLGTRAYSSWELGQMGERLVDAELRKLASRDPRWGHINSIRVGENNADIDHVVIGPAGVFTINAKYHRNASIWVAGDTLMVNGTRYPYIRNARSEARRASKLLTKACGTTVPVRGLVTPVDAGSFTIREAPADVVVINRARLAHYLRGLPETLSTAETQRILSIARLSTTWEAPGKVAG